MSPWMVPLLMEIGFVVPNVGPCKCSSGICVYVSYYLYCSGGITKILHDGEEAGMVNGSKSVLKSI